MNFLIKYYYLSYRRGEKWSYTFSKIFVLKLMKANRLVIEIGLPISHSVKHIHTSRMNRKEKELWNKTFEENFVHIGHNLFFI